MKSKVMNNYDIIRSQLFTTPLLLVSWYVYVRISSELRFIERITDVHNLVRGQVRDALRRESSL